MQGAIEVLGKYAAMRGRCGMSRKRLEAGKSQPVLAPVFMMHLRGADARVLTGRECQPCTCAVEAPAVPSSLDCSGGGGAIPLAGQPNCCDGGDGAVHGVAPRHMTAALAVSCHLR